MKNLLILIALISQQLFAQTTIDSLWTEYHKVKIDTQKVNILVKRILPLYTRQHSDSGLKYYKQATNIILNLLKKENDKNLKLFYAHNLLKVIQKTGSLYDDIGKNKIGLKYNHLLYKLCKIILEYYPHDFETYAYIGEYYWSLGNYYTNISKDSALYFYRMGLTYFKMPYRFDSLSNDYVDGLVMIHNSIASFYLNLGEYNNASIHYYEALKIKEKQVFYSQTQDNQTIKTLSSLYNNIANVKLVLQEYEDALNNYHKSLELKHKIADSTGIYTVIGMIAGVHIYKKEFDKALELLKNVVPYFERTKKISLLAKNYNNMGICYANLGNYENAIKAYKESLKYNQQMDNKYSIATQNLNIAELYNKMYMKTKEYKYLQISYEYLKEAQKLSETYNLLSIKENIYNLLRKVYASKNDYKSAYEYSLMLIDIRDSLFGVEKTKAIADAQIQYETEKKQLLIDKLNKENELKQVRLEKFQEEQKRQRTIIFFAVVIIIIVTASLLIMSRLYVKIKEAHKIVSNQKSELEVKNNQLNLAYEEIKVQKEEIMQQRDIVTAQKEHIEAIHKSLKESIEYAKYIQKAVIRPLANTIDAFVPDKFEYGLLFKPRDIVSGDFYWANYVGNHLIIAVADCTGHGVPGALMSMLGISLLNEIVRKKEITKTSQVLEQLRIEIIYALQQKGIRGEQKDGMDIGIIAVDCDTLDLQFSGANNNLIYLPHSSNEVIEIKGDKMPVAIYEKMDPYTNHTLKVKPNDILYLSTDGYKDQFGGKEQKKFLQKRLNTLLCEIRHLSMKEQASTLENTLNQWMNDEDYSNKQVDDITVLGIRVL